MLRHLVSGFLLAIMCFVLGTLAPARSAGIATRPDIAAHLGCAAQADPAQTGLATMSPEQRLGQLFMVGLSSGASNAEDLAVAGTISDLHAGNVVLYGTGWDSADKIRATTDQLQQLAVASNAGVRLFISGNQEGGDTGTFQSFYGPGFDRIPKPVDQAQGDPAALEQNATVWGQQLLAAGINLDLAPVLDTVPAGTEATNDPIGHWSRQYGSTPEAVTAYGNAFARGMHDADVAVAVKHFPGLGRVTGNTDFTAEGTTDDQFSGLNDPYLIPYADAIEQGTEFVMVSLGIYPRVDPTVAIFSPAIVTDILRRGLGFDGVVITDDVGAAEAVATVPPGDRAVDFLRAGGDMILTIKPSDIEPMVDAVQRAMAGDPGFAGQVETSVWRVLRAKAKLGLLPATQAGGCQYTVHDQLP